MFFPCIRRLIRFRPESNNRKLEHIHPPESDFLPPSHHHAAPLTNPHPTPSHYGLRNFFASRNSQRHDSNENLSVLESQSSEIRSKTLFNLTEDGGSVRDVPLTYKRYQKSAYMRFDHPMRRHVAEEARNIPLGLHENQKIVRSTTGERKSHQTRSKLVTEAEKEQNKTQNTREYVPHGRKSQKKRMSTQETKRISNLIQKPAHVTQGIEQRRQAQSLAENVLWKGVILKDPLGQVPRHLASLHSNPIYRKRRGTLILSGRKVIEETAQKMRVYPKLLLVRHDKNFPEFSPRNRSDMVHATNRVMKEIDPANDGYIGEYDIPLCAPKELLFASPRQLTDWIVLDNITDPGLLGNLLRTATAFAYDAVVMVNQCADFYDNRTVRAARGAHFQKLTQFFVLNEENGDDTTELVNQMLEHHYIQPWIYTPTYMSPLMRAPTASPTQEQNTQKKNVQTSSQILQTSPGKAILGQLSSPLPSVSLYEARRLMAERKLSVSRLGNNFVTGSLEAYCRSAHPTRRISIQHPGNALFLGEDKSGNLLPKLATRLRIKPKIIQLFEEPMPSEFTPSSTSIPNLNHVPEEEPLSLLSASCILMYNMRHANIWEVLTRAESDELSACHKQAGNAQRMFMPPGPLETPKPNLVGEEDVRAYFENAQRKRMERRMDRYTKTDEERWEEDELSRLRKDAYKHKNWLDGAALEKFTENENSLASKTWESDPYGFKEPRPEKTDSNYPNYVKDVLPAPHTREDVRKEVRQSLSFEKPSR